MCKIIFCLFIKVSFIPRSTGSHTVSITATTFTILMLLASLNSCANPCIYIVFSGSGPKQLSHSESKGPVPEDATMVSNVYLSLKSLF